MQLNLFLFPLQHMKRPALQNKQVAVLRMAFRARKVLGTFEKRTPDLEEHLSVPSLTCTRVLTPTRPRTEKNNEEKLSYQFFKSEKKKREVTGRYLVKNVLMGS